MAVPVARVHLAMAHAALPALLPTPPEWKAMPLLPTPPCAVILPKPPRKPSRADADERWDAHKKPASQSSSAGKPSSDGKSNISGGRASSCERWDINKKSVASSSSASNVSNGSAISNGKSRADAEERWDACKKPAKLAAAAESTTSSASSCSPGSRTTSSGEKRDSSNTRAISGAPASAARWDAHKKPRPSQADVLVDDGASSSGSNDMELDEPPPLALYAGPGFVASPEPSMLPIPAFILRAR
ncbi:hypothetical protein ACP70R_020051 [Stipagrostis hirtigluma subsp. patula]